MAKRYIDVYEDRTDEHYAIGVRDDGSATVWSRGTPLATWAFMGDGLAWASADGPAAAEWRADCGTLIGRVEYDGGLPDVACEPST